MMRTVSVVLACLLIVTACGPSQEERVEDLETSARTLVAAIDRALAVTDDGAVHRNGPIVAPCERDRYAVDHAAERNGLDPDAVVALEAVLVEALGSGPREQDRLEEGAASWGVVLDHGALLRVTVVPEEGRFNLSGSTPCRDVPVEEVRRIVADLSAGNAAEG